MSIIEDGAGQGYSAQVDNHGRLRTAANMIDHKQHHALDHKNLYLLQFSCTLGGTSETNIAFFENDDGTKDYEIYEIDVASTGNCTYSFKMGDTYASGGTAVNEVNSNSGSGNTLPPTLTQLYEGGASANLTLTTTNRKNFYTSVLSANNSCRKQYDGCLVLTANNAITVTATGTASDIIYVNMLVAFHDAGTVL